MKVSDLREGAVYVGKNGKRREIRRIDVFYIGDDHERWTIVYDREEGGIGRCTMASFARWAEREDKEVK